MLVTVESRLPSASRTATVGARPGAARWDWDDAASDWRRPFLGPGHVAPRVHAQDVPSRAGESGNDDDRGADSRSVSRDSTMPIGFSSKFVIAKSLCHASALI